MSLVVVKGAVIKCSHGGQLKLSTGDTRLTVDGNGAVTFGMEAGLSFGSPTKPVAGMLAPCSAQTPSTPPVFVPCVTTPAVAGQAVKLALGGKPALLDKAKGTTVSGAGPGTWSVAKAGQTKLESS
ncbi:MAG TPA: hypothetical protein VMU51_22630 [Mycobacteriales bacterium]|nr:hypothetical protein [Mycobacteriales bacterium]